MSPLSCCHRLRHLLRHGQCLLIFVISRYAPALDDLVSSRRSCHSVLCLLLLWLLIVVSSFDPSIAKGFASSRFRRRAPRSCGWNLVVLVFLETLPSSTSSFFLISSPPLRRGERRLLLRGVERRRAAAPRLLAIRTYRSAIAHASSRPCRFRVGAMLGADQGTCRGQYGL